jgi:hypothetical protein
MSDERLDEHNELLDDDPVLDYMLYQEMEKENRLPRENGGCLTFLLLTALPLALYSFLNFIIA